MNYCRYLFIFVPATYLRMRTMIAKSKQTKRVYIYIISMSTTENFLQTLSLIFSKTYLSKPFLKYLRQHAVIKEW